MRTPDEIKRGLRCCYNDERPLCEKCPYHYVRKDGQMRFTECSSMNSLGVDTMTYIERLEAKIPQWISVGERLPKSQKPVLVCAKDKIFGREQVLKAAHVGYHESSTEDYEWQDYEGDTEYDDENDCLLPPYSMRIVPCTFHKAKASQKPWVKKRSLNLESSILTTQ